MASYRRYTDEERAAAVAFVLAAGWPEREGALSQAERATGIKRQVLTRWVTQELHPPPHHLVREKMFDLREAIQRELEAVFAEMNVMREQASYRDLSIAAGILMDKQLLLAGKATDRREQTIRFEVAGLSSLPEGLSTRDRPVLTDSMTIEGQLAESPQNARSSLGTGKHTSEGENVACSPSTWPTEEGREVGENGERIEREGTA